MNRCLNLKQFTTLLKAHQTRIQSLPLWTYLMCTTIPIKPFSSHKSHFVAFDDGKYYTHVQLYTHYRSVMFGTVFPPNLFIRSHAMWLIRMKRQEHKEPDFNKSNILYSRPIKLNQVYVRHTYQWESLNRTHNKHRLALCWRRRRRHCRCHCCCC